MKKFILSKKLILIVLSILFAFSISFSVADLTTAKKVDAVSDQTTQSSSEQNSSYSDVALSLSDFDLLTANRFTNCYATNAATANDARKYVENYISSLGVTADYDVVEENYVAPQIGSNGKYTANVVFSGETNAVSVVLTISQYAEPAVLDFSSATDIKACKTSGTSLTSENGKLRMTKTSTSDWDGFFLQFSTGALTDQPFMAENYRYLKVKFKLESNYPAMMFWVFPENGKNMYKDFHLGSEVSKNNEVTLIIDLSVSNWTDTSIWCYNDTNNTVKTYKFLSNPDDPRYVYPYEGKIDTFRFNFGTWAGQRTALVDYLGFFSTFEEARSYSPIASDFTEAAQELVSTELTTLWGNAESKAEAEETAIELIGEKYGLSCSIINSTYVVPTVESKGKLTFDAAFKVGARSEIVKGITLIIDEKPGDYILLDLKDQEFVDGGGVEFAMANHYWDGEYLKMDGTDGVTEDGFYFHVYFKKMQEQFYLQDYPFIVFRYKRIGIAGGQMFFWPEGLSGDVPHFELFFGRHEGDWYTSILCTDSRSYDEPVVINYNETRGEIEPVPYHVAYGYNKTQWEGLVETIRFNYSRKKYVDREAWLDYIGFFSTFEEAESYYIQKSLNEYQGGTLEYFEADTKDNAINSINKLMGVKVGLGDYKINLTNVNYTAPVKNVSNGSLSAKVKILASDGTTIFNKSISYDINCAVETEKTEMFFSNPYFIRELTGSMVSCVDYQKAKLTGYNPNFTWSVNVNKQFFLREKPYAVFKVDAQADTLVFTANGMEYILDYDISGENIVVLDLQTGDFYINDVKVGNGVPKTLPSGRITEIGIKFKSATSTTSSVADIYSIVFCSTIEEAKAYTGVQDKSDINAISATLLSANISDVDYSKADTEMKALKQAKKVVEKLLENYTNCSVFDVYSVNYTQSTLTTKGMLDFVVTIQTTDDKYAAQFSDVTLSLPIKVRPAETGVALEVEKGYDFDGSNYFQALRDLEKMPSTIEMVVEVYPSSTNKVLLSNKTSTANNYFAVEIDANGKIVFVYNGQDVLTSTTAINNGNKTQIAVTIEEGKAVLYINGVKNTENTTFTLSNAISLRAPLVGADYTMIGNGFNNAKYFVGKIYHLSYFDNVVAKEELSSNAFVTNLSGYWVFNSIDEDNRVKNHKGVRDAFFYLYNKENKYSHEGHEFMGYDENVALSVSLGQATSFEWWMKVSADYTSGKYSVIINESESFVISIVDGVLTFKNGDITFTANGIDVCDGDWKHYAIVVDGNAKLYVDGEVVGQYNVGGNALDSIGKLIIGGLERKDVTGATTANDFVGSLSDIRIWNTVKSASDIKNNRFVYPAGNESGLITSIRLDLQKYLVYTDYSSTGNNGTLSAKGWYRLENITTDYTFAHFADTQSYMFKDDGAGLLSQMYAAVKDKQEEYNIVYAEHLGDACQDATNLQWEIISDSHLNIEGLIPYVIALGNHDYASPYTGIGATFRDVSLFDEQFTLERMEAQFETIEHARFGGTYDGKSAENMYMFFDAGEPTVNYIAFALEFGPRDSVLKWVEDVLKQYPNHKAIISTHCYYNMHGDKSTYNSTTNDAFRDGNEGVEIWDKLVSKCDNIVMVMCGHSQNQDWQGHVDKNDFGNDVVQILADPSAMVTGFPSDEGLMMYMCFSNDGTMHTYYYSPLYDAYYNSTFENTYEMRVV